MLVVPAGPEARTLVVTGLPAGPAEPAVRLVSAVPRVLDWVVVVRPAPRERAAGAVPAAMAVQRQATRELRLQDPRANRGRTAAPAAWAAAVAAALPVVLPAAVARGATAARAVAAVTPGRTSVVTGLPAVPVGPAGRPVPAVPQAPAAVGRRALPVKAGQGAPVAVVVRVPITRPLRVRVPPVLPAVAAVPAGRVVPAERLVRAGRLVSVVPAAVGEPVVQAVPAGRVKTTAPIPGWPGVPVARVE